MSQLTLGVTLDDWSSPRPDAAAVAAGAPFLPRTMVEEDDTLLSAVQLSESVEVVRLTPLEQLATLGTCELLRASRATDASTVEQMEPFVHQALATPQAWAVQTVALRTKARLESSKKRRRHQSLMQLQALVDDLVGPAGGAKDTILSRHIGVEGEADEGGKASAAAPEAPEAVASARLACFWASSLAPIWTLQAELARTMASLGLLGEATKLFEQLELWEEFVAAMVAMNQRAQAEAVVRQRLETAPTPTMWCYLGDLTDETCHYERAWALSEGKCARAKLSLGAAAVKGERWAEGRSHLLDALGVKAHYAEASFCAGVCSLKLEDAAAAMSDFRKVVALDPSHFQAWSNLGVLFNRDGQKREALYAFREACRLRGDQWQLWQQQAATAIELGCFELALFACTKASETGGPPSVQAASIIVQAVAKDLRTAEGSRAGRLLPRARALCEANCAKEPDVNAHWEVRLHLERECGTRADLRQALKEQVAALENSTLWETDVKALDEFSEAVAQLVELQLECGEAGEFKAAKSLVTRTLYAARAKLEASAGCDSLKMLAARLARHDEDDD